MKKKFLTVALSAMLAVTAVAGLSACGNGGEDLNELALPAYENIETPDYSGITVPEDFKFGLICLHDESSTYDKNFIDAAKKACKEMGLKDNQLVMKTSIPELVDCKNAALNLVDEGCDVIFADSFGHEPWLLEAAKAKPEVEFCHATGTTAHTENLDNFHNAFASIYEGRYLAGVAAGMKLNEMIKDGKFTAEQAKIGYVGAFTMRRLFPVILLSISAPNLFATPLRWMCSLRGPGMMLRRKKLQRKVLLPAVASLFPSMRIRWALLRPVKKPVFPMFPTMEAPSKPALKRLSFLLVSIGPLTLNTLLPRR